MGSSKLPKEIMDLFGLNTPLYRHLLSNLGAMSTSYLECGVYTGTTLLAACFQNRLDKIVAVDSWRSQAIFERSATYKKSLKKRNPKPGPLQHFKANLKRFGQFMPPVQIIDGESFDSSTMKKVAAHAPFDLFHYDADHSYESQRKALAEYAQFLTHPAIVVVHDYEMRSDSVLKDGKDWTEEVRQGTEDGLQDIEYTNPELFRAFSMTPTGEKEAIVLVLG